MRMRDIVESGRSHGARPRIAVLSVLELPNRRTTRDTNAESLTAGSSLLETLAAGLPAVGSVLGADKLGGLSDEKDLVECAHTLTFGSSTCRENVQVRWDRVNARDGDL